MSFVGTWTQAAMDLPATTGINNTDNVEQVLIASPAATGTWQAVVSYSGTLTNNQQNYSLLITGGDAEEPPPPPLALSSVSPDSGLSGSTVTLDLTGTSLTANTTVKLTKSGQSDISATSLQLIGESLRCQINLTGAAAGPWNVVAAKPNLETATLPDAFTVIGAIWSENFDGTVSGWTSEGTNSWTLSTALNHSPAKSYFAAGPASRTTAYLVSPAFSIPSTATDMQLKFMQNRQLSAPDAGVLEFSLDGGAWYDVVSINSGASFASNGYNTTLNSNSNSVKSDFAGRQVWTGNSNGFVETIVNLTNTSKYAGHSLRIRWGIATDTKTASTG
jgi:hypothetical protein